MIFRLIGGFLLGLVMGDCLLTPDDTMSAVNIGLLVLFGWLALVLAPILEDW